MKASSISTQAFRAVMAVVLLAAPTQAQLFGTGKFKIEKRADRFSTNGLATIIGRNNRVSSKSPVGGVYIGPGGVYLEPEAQVRQTDGQLVRLLFLIHNETESDTLYGSPNSLGQLRQVTFITDGGSPIAFPITSADEKVSDVPSYNTITHSASSAISERGLVLLTREQFHQIATAQTIAVKLDGSERSVIYNERDISKAFLANLRTFEAALPRL
jgi:hypothetical protein